MVGVDQVREKLSTVIDPDLKKDIVSMGMILGQTNFLEEISKFIQRFIKSNSAVSTVVFYIYHGYLIMDSHLMIMSLHHHSENLVIRTLNQVNMVET